MLGMRELMTLDSETADHNAGASRIRFRQCLQTFAS